MSQSNDPPRLRTLGEGLPELLTHALGAVHDDTPTPHEVNQMWRQVWLALGLPAPVLPLPVAAPVATAKVGAAAKVGTVAAAASKSGSAALAWIALPVAISGIGAAVFLHQRANVEPEVPGFSTARTEKFERATKTPRPSSLPEAANVPPVAANVEISVPSATRALPVPAQPTPPQPVPTFGSEASTAPIPAESEVKLLSRAQAALAANPSQALSIAGEHEHRFPSGTFVQEREVIVIQALVRLGRTLEARARAEHFHTLFPGSAHGRRVDVLVR